MNFDNRLINKIKTFVPLCVRPLLSVRVVSCAALVTSLLLMGTSAFATPREQAKRMHDRLAGVPPSSDVLCVMEKLIVVDPQQAAHIVMSTNLTADKAAKFPGLNTAETDCGLTPDTLDNSASRKAFYSTSLRDFVTPWTNRAQTKHADLNDYVALVIGMIRDDVPFDTVLSTDLYYKGAGTVAVDNNNHFRDLGNGDFDLSDNTVLQQTTRTLPGGAVPAGVTTTRAAGLAFFSNGTNRRMLRFTAINYLCRDLEQMKDPTRSHDRVRQDASRSPGGDSTIFLTNCVGCHAGMDGLAESYAYWEWLTVDADGDGNPDENAGQLLYKQNYDPVTLTVSNATDPVTNPNGVTNKYHINSGNFIYGFRTEDDNWVNYWREGPNSDLGWDFNTHQPRTVNPTGNGPDTMGVEIAATKAFAQCQVEKVYKHVCLQNPVDADTAELEAIITGLNGEAYNMRNVFAKVAPLCMGD